VAAVSVTQPIEVLLHVWAGVGGVRYPIAIVVRSGLGTTIMILEPVEILGLAGASIDSVMETVTVGIANVGDRGVAPLAASRRIWSTIWEWKHAFV
jgi:hypothetical protein